MVYELYVLPVPPIYRALLSNNLREAKNGCILNLESLH